MERIIFIIVTLLVLGIVIQPIRKGIGLTLVILGIMECLTIVGIIIGLPTILIGGIMYHLKTR